MSPSRARKLTVRQSLQVLGINDATVFGGCYTRDEEFSKVVKKTYFRMVLQNHPDKGGNAETFREIQTTFELLRDLHNGKRGGAWMFCECMEVAASTAAQVDDEEFDMSGYYADFSNMETPSWEYYDEAADETVPGYRMELAKSGRSRCKQKGKAKRCSLTPDGVDEACTDVMERTEPEIITQREVRIGSLDDRSGGYGRWCHLRCWRVPYKVWLGLPDPEQCQDQQKFASALASMNLVLLSGFYELPQDDKDKVIRYVMDKNNWARKTKPREKKPTEAEAEQEAVGNFAARQEPDNPTSVASSSTTIVTVSRQRLVMPVPDKRGAKSNALSGKTFVLTGVFPEAGGGMGLSLGKDKVKAMIKSFGGRVTGSISGKTDVLIVGKQPGYSKVSKARASETIVMMDLKDITDGLHSGLTMLDDFPDRETMLIKDFSEGYGNNGLALLASSNDVATAQGVVRRQKAPVKKAAIEVTKKSTAAAKRKPFQETIAEPNIKKRRTPRVNKDGDSTALVAVKPIRKKNVRGKTGRKPEKNAAPTNDEEENMKISCDECGKDCTKISWFVRETEEDFCNNCHSENPRAGAVAQSQGK